jgi:hypothetical protein
VPVSRHTAQAFANASCETSVSPDEPPPEPLLGLPSREDDAPWPYSRGSFAAAHGPVSIHLD